MLDTEYFLEQQEKATLDYRISAISDGYEGTDPQDFSPDYLQSYYEGKNIYLQEQFNKLLEGLRVLDHHVQTIGLELNYPTGMSAEVAERMTF